jgi:Ca-activated chloride channel family protein
VRDVDGFRRIAENCRRMGAAVTTIGVDVSYDEKVMSALARSSNGRHFFVADPTGLPSIFDQEMASLTKTVANRVELTVDLAPGVFAEHVFDRVNSGDGSQVVVPLGTFSGGDHKTVLVRLRVPRGPAGERPIAAVRLRYDDLAESKAGLCEGQLAARLTTDSSALTPLDSFVSARVSSTQTAETLEAANDLFKAGKADEARALITRQRKSLDADRQEATKWAPRATRAAVDKVFGDNERRLGNGSAGFAQPEPGVAATPPAADHKGQAQVRQNQQDATQATE